MQIVRTCTLDRQAQLRLLALLMRDIPPRVGPPVIPAPESKMEESCSKEGGQDLVDGKGINGSDIITPLQMVDGWSALQA